MKLLGQDLLTVEQFLRFPEVRPPLEYFGGRVVQKMSPNRPHGLLAIELGAHLVHFVKANQLGLMYSELRSNFAGSSYVPDLSFIAHGRIPRDHRGELASNIRFAPDLAVEILSPGQTVAEISKKLRFAIKHGLRLGWLIHPVRKQVSIFRPGCRVQVLRSGEILTGEDVLPGFALPVDELFAWVDQG